MIEGVRSFLNPPLTFGWGSLTNLSQLQGHRAAIVTDDAAMEQLGFLEQAMTHLEAAGLETSVIAQISHEPTTVDIDDARPALDDFNPDWIVALGGGSVLDSAKALWLFAEHPDMDWEAAFQFNDLPPINQTRLVAVPSTSGTGSETSRVSVIVDDNNGMKRLIFSSEIIPTLAILDPALPMTMPPSLSAASAFDALSHAIESSIATISNEFTISLALGAIRLIFQYLPDAYHGDRLAREHIHYAATMAGMAINNSTAGLAHGMDQIGPLFGVPHGVVCAVLLPITVAFTLEAANSRFAEMGRVLFLSGQSEKELSSSFLQELIALQRKVDLPSSFGDLNIPVGRYLEHLDELISAAQSSGSTLLSPRIPSIEEMRDLFLQAYYGQSPEAQTL